MNTTNIGNSEIKIAPLVLGGNVFGWTIDDQMSFRVLDAFVDSGFNCIDTADLYSKWVPGNHGGESETIIGKWLKQSGKRSQVIVATKVGMEMAPDKKGLSAAHIKNSVDESLARLQTDYIDLYQAHKDDPETTLEETLGAFSDLVKAGKVRAIGASNYSRERLSEALHVSERNGLCRYECLQPQYNLYDRLPYETDLEPLCQQMGVGVISYYSLASGFLTGKYRSAEEATSAKRAATLKTYFDDRGARVLAVLSEVAQELSSTSARVALAWLIARPSITAPIASATSVNQLHDILGSASLTLPDEAIQRLNKASE